MGTRFRRRTGLKYSAIAADKKLKEKIMDLIKYDAGTLPAVTMPEWKPEKVTSFQELRTAEQRQKELTKLRTEFISSFKPVKQEIDKIKQQALDYEKAEVEKVTSVEDMNAKFISAFKTEVGTLQSELKALVASYYQIFEKCKYEISAHSRKMESVDIELDRVQIQNSKELAVEKAKKLESLEKTELKIEIQNIQPHQTAPEVKILKKKDEIKGKEVYSIANQEAFIFWAIHNNPSLLKIEVKKAEVNKWLQSPENQTLPFVKKETSFS